jgi:hypothetical protein
MLTGDWRAPEQLRQASVLVAREPRYLDNGLPALCWCMKQASREDAGNGAQRGDGVVDLAHQASLARDGGRR